MIRWTKDGQVSRYGWHPGKSWEVHSEGVSDYPLMCHELADALDVAVANMTALVKCYETYRGRGVSPAPQEYSDLVAAIFKCREALSQIGVDHD